MCDFFAPECMFADCFMFGINGILCIQHFLNRPACIVEQLHFQIMLFGLLFQFVLALYPSMYSFLSKYLSSAVLRLAELNMLLKPTALLHGPSLKGVGMLINSIVDSNVQTCFSPIRKRYLYAQRSYTYYIYLFDATKSRKKRIVL